MVFWLFREKPLDVTVLLIVLKYGVCTVAVNSIEKIKQARANVNGWLEK
jgi:hypothetical protein